MTTAPDEEAPGSQLQAAPTYRVSSEPVIGAIERLARAPFQEIVRATASGSALPDAIPAEHLLKKALHALELTKKERVLELGSQTGYETALLSQLGGEVFSLVSDSASAAARRELLKKIGCSNVEVVVGHDVAGWPPRAPYSAILVVGGATHLPPALLDQLAFGGRLIIPLGDDSGQLLELVHRHRDGFRAETLASCHVRMLAGAPRRPPSFPWRREG